MTAAVAGAVAGGLRGRGRAPTLRSPRRLRGAAIVWMAAFHFCFDLNYFGFIHQSFYTDPLWTVQRTCIVSLFLFGAGAARRLRSAQHQALAALLAPLGAGRGLRAAGLAGLVC